MQIVLVAYSINPTASNTAASPANVKRLIYALAQEGVPTNFLQWHQGTSVRGAQIMLLHSVSSYIPRMGLPASPWDNLSFALKGDVTYGAVT